MGHIKVIHAFAIIIGVLFITNFNKVLLHTIAQYRSVGRTTVTGIVSTSTASTQEQRLPIYQEEGQDEEKSKWTPDKDFNDENKGQSHQPRKREKKTSANNEESTTFSRAPRTPLCNKHFKQPVIDEQFDNHPQVFFSSDFKVSVCATPKTARTFWNIIMNKLVSQSKSHNPTVFNSKTTSKKAANRLKLVHSQDLASLGGTNIIMVRNPYYRIFSTFIEKIYIPTLCSTTREIKRIFLDDHVWNKTEALCTNEVSFSNFLSFIVHRPPDSNTNWQPITNLCRPCDLNHVRLVKLESFSTDVAAVVEELKIPTELKSEILANTTTYNTATRIKVMLNQVVDKGFDCCKECVNVTEFAYKMWTALQIQGYISYTQKFPRDSLANLKNKKLKSQLLATVLKTIHSNPLSAAERKKQRLGAVAAAYKRVPNKILKKFKKMYLNDFEIFGYKQDLPG